MDDGPVRLDPRRNPGHVQLLREVHIAQDRQDRVLWRRGGRKMDRRLHGASRPGSGPGGLLAIDNHDFVEPVLRHARRERRRVDRGRSSVLRFHRSALPAIAGPYILYATHARQYRCTLRERCVIPASVILDGPVPSVTPRVGHPSGLPTAGIRTILGPRHIVMHISINFDERWSATRYHKYVSSGAAGGNTGRAARSGCSGTLTRPRLQ